MQQKEQEQYRSPYCQAYLQKAHVMMPPFVSLSSVMSQPVCFHMCVANNRSFRTIAAFHMHFAKNSVPELPSMLPAQSVFYTRTHRDRRQLPPTSTVVKSAMNMQHLLSLFASPISV